MKRYGFLLLAALILAALPGCEDGALDPTLASKVVVTFTTLNESGVPTSVFRYGEDIVFAYSARNRTGMDLSWVGYYESFPASFSCVSGRARLGSTLSLVQPKRTEGVFGNGGVVSYRTSWQSNPALPWLPPGEYEVTGNLTYRFDDYPSMDTYRSAIITVLPPVGQEHVFSLDREIWFFALKKGDLFWANVFRNPSGRDELYASVLVDSEDPENACLPEYGTSRCLRQEILPPILLDTAQQTTLDALIRDFPTVLPEISGACDPAAILRYQMGDEVHQVSPCATGPSEYTDHAWDLAEFVNGIVQGQ